MSAAVLALVAQQQAQDAAWQAWLADVPMTWLRGI
jgi:predicted transcriptional regulator